MGRNFKSDKFQISPARSPEILSYSIKNVAFHSLLRWKMINPFAPKSDQFQISPAISPEILHHTVWRTWLFIAYSDERWSYYLLLATPLIHFSLKRWENVLFELGTERVKLPILTTSLIHFSLKRWENVLFELGTERIKLPILTTSLIHFSLKRWENVLFELGTERIKLPILTTSLIHFSERLGEWTVWTWEWKG